VDCVMDNADGTKTAYFSYSNVAPEAVIIPVGSSGSPVVTNAFEGGNPSRGQPTLFLPGVQRGAVAVLFQGEELTWSVRAPRSAASRTRVTATTRRCPMVQPEFECQGYVDGVLRAKGGYTNPNPFVVELPYGGLNFFAPPPVHRDQPASFLPGRNPGAFSVQKASLEGSLDWVVNGIVARANASLPVCAGECVDTAIGAIRGELDDIAVALADITREAADVLASAAGTETSSRVARRQAAALAERASLDADRARAKADAYVVESRALTIQFPDVVKNCPEAPAVCSTIDRGPTIDRLRSLYIQARNTAQRTVARAYFRQTGATNRKDALVRQAKELERQGLANLDQLPRTETVCK